MIGVQPALFSDLFPRDVRYSGVAIGHEVGSALAGGITPLLAIGLLSRFNLSGVVGLLCALASVTTTALIVQSRRSAII